MTFENFCEIVLRKTVHQLKNNKDKTEFEVIKSAYINYKGVLMTPRENEAVRRSLSL